MKEILCLQHVPHEGPGAISEWAESRGFALRVWRMDDWKCAPETTDRYPLIVVLGGPMNVDDEAQYPWLRDEKRFLFRQLNRRARMLGICLGAQLLAQLLGAEVGRQKEKEIGWYPVHWTPEAQAHPFFEGAGASTTVLHWHAQGFSLPPLAVKLASSEACANQGFVWKQRVVGLQFHLEMRAEEVRSLVESAPEEFTAGGPFVQFPQALLAHPTGTQDKAILFQLLDRFFLPFQGMT